MSNATIECIYANTSPGCSDLTPNEVLLACDANGRLIKKRGRTIHADGSRSNEHSYILWCRDPTAWLRSSEGIRYRKKMDSWGLRDYWGHDIGYTSEAEQSYKEEVAKEELYKELYEQKYPELDPHGEGYADNTVTPKFAGGTEKVLKKGAMVPVLMIGACILALWYFLFAGQRG